jgi:zinc protease
VSFRIWFDAGSQRDPKGKEGLAAIVGSMLTEASTRQHRYEEILDLLYPLAGSYSASVSTEMAVVSGRIHKDNLAQYYPLLIQAILEPAFTQDDLDRLKSQTLNYLENVLRYASDEDLGKAVLYNKIFAGTPYGHIPEGTIDAVRSITLDDVRNFYRAHYNRGSVVIGIGGGYDAKLVQRLREDLAKLPAGRPTPLAPPAPKPIHGRQVTIVEKDAPATAISLGFPISVLRGSREWYALAIANSWLGEHRNSSSHLYQVLREARGLNYGDYSYIEHFPHGSQLQLPPQNVARRQQIFEIWIRPVHQDAGRFALRAALREYQHLVEHGMTEEEFKLTKNFLKKYVLHYAPTTMERLGYALDDRFYGIEGSHLDKFRKMMDEITLEEVNAAVRKHLQTENLQIVLITKDAAELKKALAAGAPSPYQYPTPKSKEILDEDRQIATFPLGIKAENVTIVKVEDMFVK